MNPAISRVPLRVIEICMGSSCFARGNNRNIEVIQDYLNLGKLPAGVELTGHLCQGHCKSGPNLTLDGQMHHEVDPIAVIALMSQYTTKAAT
jgi:NADH:ubiquinone oxidoreductase subunit E